MPDPRGFLRHRRQLGPERPVAERVKDYRELHHNLSHPTLEQQARRCMGCAVPFCHSACPLHNLVPDWNQLTSQGEWRRALDRLHRTNNFPEFTGRVCPAPCETSCVLAINDEPVAIKEVERTLADRGLEEGWVAPRPPTRQSGRRVAVVGSGPAGLAAAQQLARAGHAVTVFEASDLAGGLLRYGIPDYKLPKMLLDRRLRQLQEEGVVFRCGARLGANLELQQLRAGHDAVCLALGARKPRELPIPGRELAGIHLAMEYLEQQNRRVAGRAPSGAAPISARGRRVVILGGGDTGADCLGNVHREGCASVIQLELMPEPPMQRAANNPWPEWPLVLRRSPAHEEGGTRGFAVETLGFGGRQGRVAWLRTRDLATGAGVHVRPLPGGRRTPADLVLLALGFIGVDDEAGALARAGLGFTERGVLAADQFGATSVPGVFACGDAVRGASLVVHAIADGRRVAGAIDTWLGRRQPTWGMELHTEIPLLAL
ncbi:MAG: glutamate synthase subunit beta [Candidatus Dormibacteria bacterium]